MDTYGDYFISSAAHPSSHPSTSPSGHIPASFGTFSASPLLSSSPLRQSTGASCRKVSLFSSSDNNKRGASSDPEDAAGSPTRPGLLKQSLAQQQKLDEERAMGGYRRTGRRGSLDDSTRRHRRDDSGTFHADPRQIADFKLTSQSSSAFASAACTSSPDAEETRMRSNAATPVATAAARKNYQTFSQTTQAPPASSSSSSSSSPMSDTHAQIKRALRPTGISLLRDPVRTSTAPEAVPTSSKSSSSTSTVSFAACHADAREKDRKKKKAEKSFVAFVNTKSGAQKGEEALELLTEELGEDRVFDLVELDDLEDCLEQFRGEENLCIVVGGGDGTYSSIINALIKMKFQPMPTLATLPMGTGNDLAREFGWGGGFEPDEDSLHETFDLYQQAEPSPLDIWRVEIRPQNEVTGEFSESKRTVQYMFNYFNIGFDAHVALGFDNTRKKHPWLFKAQFLNKLFYLCSAPGPAVNGMTDLHSCVMAEVDDDPITLPKDLKTFVVLNFTCYQAGLDIWGKAQEADNSAGYPILWSTPSMSDRTVEVVGIGGLDHETAVRTNMSKGYRLGQGSTLKLRILDDVAINIDGEPEWQKAPCEVSITRWGSISILRSPESDDNEEVKEKRDKERREKKKDRKQTTKVRIGSKRIAKRRRTAAKPTTWEQSSKFSFGGFLVYMLTGSV